MAHEESGKVFSLIVPKRALVRLSLCLWGPRIGLILFLQALGSEETRLHLE